MSGPSLIERMRGRGLPFILRRALREVYAPDTRIGRALRPATAPAWAVFRRLHDAWHAPSDTDASDRRDTLTLFYDLEVAPITYDLTVFLAVGEAERRRLGLRDLAVVFVPGRKDGVRAEMKAYEEAIGPDARRWRLHNLCIPLTTLVPSCGGYTLCRARDEAVALHRACGKYVLPENYSPFFPMPPDTRDLIRMSKAGQELKVFASPPPALAYVRAWLADKLEGRRLITITLRDSAFTPQRNSNLAAWTEFARELDPRAYFVVFIPDSENAWRPMPERGRDCVAFREACWNVGLRSAIYELAWLNLGSSGGPLGLCNFNPKARYLMFKIVTPDVPQATASVLAERGYVIGEQPPFVGPGQEWVWEPDDLEVIRRAFQRMAARLEAGEAVPAGSTP